ncbi:MAG: bifunctional 4-hydroxy-3-methylbut-2-enyl diphosphate reductase/30S ribosomal protein S1 [Firmicutes bacterium]|nr:bifunctional 4-hydroxy-3-methylbut-2-enyl diphosphate reductase/30S ribosomal protein S1 [Bacillota bacterium]
MGKVVFEKGPYTITLADNSGFCYGVRAALDTVYDAIGNKAENTEIYTYGPLIHNESVVEELAQKGVSICNSPEEAGEHSTVIIRSHGVNMETDTALRKNAGAVIDATCPHVKKIHRLAAEAEKDGYQVVIIGDREHPEVKGINGWCRNSAVIIGSKEDVPSIPKDRPVFVVAQTTISQALWDECIEAVTASFEEPEIKKTICRATENRQNDCRALSEESDLMIIIGSKSSSNTRKLYETASSVCEKTYFVENCGFLPLQEILKCNKIGISAGASAPERIIKEVITHMSEVITNNVDELEVVDAVGTEEEPMDMSAFMDEIEKSMRTPQRSEIVKGKVIQVGPREIYVNLGWKKDGIIPKSEMALEPGQEIETQFKVGDIVEAKVVKNDDGEGNILLSRKRIEISEQWNEIFKAFEEKAAIEVKVQRAVKGGVIALYKEVSGFIPMSQLNDRYVEKADEFIGQTLTVKVTRVDQRRNKAVFSHKAYLNEEKSKKIAAVWDAINIGDVIEGTVMRFTDYGAFVDIGGIDGLLHISEISWGKLRHPREVLEIGQKVSVKILSMNQEKGKISLGLKQLSPEPWSVINENYKVGDIVKGKVVQIKEYGAFVELEPGLDGLVHISQIAPRRVNNIADEVSIGDEVSTKILEIDEERRRISLSMKEAIGSENAEAVEEEAAVEAAEEVEAAEAVEAVEAEAPAEAEAQVEEAAVEAAAEEAVEETPAE